MMARKTEGPGNRQMRAAVQRLESLQRAGVTHLGRPPVVSTPATAATSGPTRQDDGRTAALAEIRQQVAACTRCEELAHTRTQTVFGTGDPHARLVFLGEAPGADEDRQGEPFVGRAGQLLTRIIEACTLRREEVYILNILKCRPPDNRTPTPTEATNCREHLDRQLAVIRPEFICCLGSVAAQNLLDTSASIGRLRGRLHEYGSLFHEGGSIKVLCTYHPAYLLRNPAAKRQVWDDMQTLMAEMGIEVPKR
jgi:uracil-DNA glycosylase family 4